MNRTRIKICGLTTPADARLAAEIGADAVGLVFAKSPRQVDVKRAGEIVSVLPPFVTPVGLFVDAPPEFILEVSAELGLDTVQLHGTEPPEITGELAPLTVIKAFRIANEQAVQDALEWCRRAPRRPCGVLLDAFSPKAAGGTGETFDWALIPPPQDRTGWPPIILAGGLCSENVAEAVRRVRPYAVDVSSGVESLAGVKDPAQVRAFIQAVIHFTV